MCNKTLFHYGSLENCSVRSWFSVIRSECLWWVYLSEAIYKSVITLTLKLKKIILNDFLLNLTAFYIYIWISFTANLIMFDVCDGVQDSCCHTMYLCCVGLAYYIICVVTLAVLIRKWSKGEQSGIWDDYCSYRKIHARRRSPTSKL